MLKIPTFILGGLLILTGLAGYLFQDAGLSLKLTGPLADDAEFTLSDGNDSVVVDLGFPSQANQPASMLLDGTSPKSKTMRKIALRQIMPYNKDQLLMKLNPFGTLPPKETHKKHWLSMQKLEN